MRADCDPQKQKKQMDFSLFPPRSWFIYVFEVEISNRTRRYRFYCFCAYLKIVFNLTDTYDCGPETVCSPTHFPGQHHPPSEFKLHQYGLCT